MFIAKNKRKTFQKNIGQLMQLNFWKRHIKPNRDDAPHPR